MIEVVDLPVPGNNFIMVFKTSRLDICDDLINLWRVSEKSPGAVFIPSESSGMVDNSGEPVIRPSIKDSIDVNIPYDVASRSIFQEYCNIILQPCIDRYIARYPFCNEGAPWGIVEFPNIQYYPPGGGYKEWHCERNCNNHESSARHLVFMTYLNDVYDEADYQGGTEWIHQNVKLNARRGYTAIWPADWTHTHRGIVSPNREKYIITGWLNYTN